MTNKHEDTAWPEPHAERLRVMWRDNPSSAIARAIFAEFGVLYTRNAVVGKASRMGLGRKRASPSNLVHRVARKPRGSMCGKQASTTIKDERIQLRADDVMVSCATPADPITKQRRSAQLTSWITSTADTAKQATIPDIVQPSDCSVLLADARDDQCKWPASADIRDMRVCGRLATVGAYCAAHALKGYSTLPTRKRQARFHAVQETDHR